jgi:hypothetical protein
VTHTLDEVLLYAPGSGHNDVNHLVLHHPPGVTQHSTQRCLSGRCLLEPAAG